MPISPIYPFTLTNGTVADATQVMANFNQIQSDVNNNAAHNGANSDITSLSGLTTPLSIAQGGTGQTTAPNALTALITGPINELEGTAIASAATINLDTATGNLVHVTGTTTITAVTLSPGRRRIVIFDGSLTLTNSANLLLPGAANITTQVGDIATFVGDASSVIRVADYLPLSGGSVVSSLNQPHITGLLPTGISGTNTTATVSVSNGQAVDSTGRVMIVGLSLTNWAVSNGNNINGFQGGTTLPNSTTIHFFICQGTSGVGLFAAATLTPTIPTGYNAYFRRIFSLVTNSSGTPLPGTSVEGEGGAQIFYLTTQILDANQAATTTGSRTLYTLTVPNGLKVRHLGRYTSAGQTSFLVTSPDETDVAVGNVSTAPINDFSGNASFAGVVSTLPITTNTSGQIGVRSTAVATVSIDTRGWVDFRRA